MIRLDGNIPEITQIYDITVITARLEDKDKYFSTNIGKHHKESGYVVTRIVWNKNWLLDKGISRYEVWARKATGGEEFLWKFFDNMSVSVTLDGK